MYGKKIIGLINDINDLGQGDETGLDLYSKKRKFIIELKNRFNTDNSSSRKANFNKLAKYKEKHKNFDCIYGVIIGNTYFLLTPIIINLSLFCGTL